MRCLQSLSAEGKRIVYYVITYKCKNSVIHWERHIYWWTGTLLWEPFDKQTFCEEALNSLKSKHTQTSFNRTVIVTLLENVRKTLASSSGVNFENLHSLSHKACYSLAGSKKVQFENIYSQISTLMNSTVRTVKTCLAILLTKLRTGLPNHLLGTIFYLTQDQIQRCILVAELVWCKISFLMFHHICFESSLTLNLTLNT